MTTAARILSAVTVAALASLAPTDAAADVTPQAGTWSVGLYEHTWGRGDSIFCDDLGGGISCVEGSLAGTDNFGGGSANDAISSYMICNNLGYTRTFRVQLYVDANYSQRFEYALLTIDDDECVVRNAVRNDVTSSFQVGPA